MAFEGQLHIFCIIGIFNVAFQIVDTYELAKGKIFVLVFMRDEMGEEHWQLEQLVGFCHGKQVNGQEKYCNCFFHVTKLGFYNVLRVLYLVGGGNVKDLFQLNLA